MRLHKTTRRVALGVLACLLMAASNASATHGSVENTGASFATMWTPLEFEVAGTTIRCNVTLWGRIGGATFSKRAGLRVGSVIEVEVAEPCTGGRIRVLRETLPWELTYGSFGGTLPSIASIRLSLVGLAAKITPEGLPECLFRTEVSRPAKTISTVTREAGGALEIPSTRLDETAGIETSGGFLCTFAGAGHLKGTGREEPESVPPMIVSLI